MEFVDFTRGRKQPLVSIILVDWGVRESFHSVYYLNRQSFPRAKYELIWIEFYNRGPAERRDLEGVDKLLMLDFPRDVPYHKHLLYNAGIVAAQGAICVFCDSDAIFPPSFVDSIYRAFQADPQIALHVDEVRSENRRFYPFNYPTIKEVLSSEGVINWTGHTTT